jgi:purine-binding chemotaxis protein CheW
LPSAENAPGPFAPGPAEDALRTEYLAFRLAEKKYAIPVAHVAEILKPPPITEVPRAPTNVRGVVSVRGKLVTVLDLRRRLRLRDAPIDRKSRILLTAMAGEPIGLFVDEVDQVWRLADHEIESAQVLGDDQAAYVAGIGRPTGSSEILILLDLQPLVESF